MNAPSPVNEEDNGEQTFIDESDILEEYEIDDEELPDADEEDGTDEDEEFDGVDDSIHIFMHHRGELYTVVCSPTDATLVATGGGDDTGFMWRISRGKWAFELQRDWDFELQGHQDSVSSLSFSVDGQLIASGGLDGLVKVWDVEKKELKCTLEGPSGGIEVASERTLGLGWCRGFLTLDVEC